MWEKRGCWCRDIARGVYLDRQGGVDALCFTACPVFFSLLKTLERVVRSHQLALTHVSTPLTQCFLRCDAVFFPESSSALFFLGFFLNLGLSCGVYP